MAPANKPWETLKEAAVPSLSNISPPDDDDDTHGRVVVNTASCNPHSFPGSPHRFFG
jgi:hypothetical protein